MPTNYTGRVLLTLFILLIALICIFPPGSLFTPGLSFQERLALKPGIDMVGGIDLIYKITPPTGEGTRGSSNVVNLAETVMEALKKRVDPDGLRNLVWRPIGTDELEIQMPHNPHSRQADEARTDYTAAEDAIQSINISQNQVLAALDVPAAQRDARLAALAGNDPNRHKLFATLASLSTELANDKAAATRPSTTATEKDRILNELDVDGQKFEDLKTHIQDDNVNVRTLTDLVDDLAADPQKVQPQIDAQIQRFSGFPQGQGIVKDFIDKYKAYSAVKDQLDDAADLKQLLRGSGILEFHIRGFNKADPLYEAMVDRMKTGGRGPLPEAGDKYRWYLLDTQDDHDKMGGEVAEWNGKYYLLCLTTPDASMTPSSGWGLERAFLSSDSNSGLPAVGFQFDTNGGHLFGDLTTRWKPDGSTEYGLATILDNKVITCPNINGAIVGGSGIITGGGGGFTQKELDYLINTLNAGSLPAKLEDDPISERTIGPAIGAENLHKGLVACGFGLVVVGVFLISYYYIAGIVAFFAILLNLVLILGALAALNATFTLPSIAGIVLTVGTAVDANVLVFERLREEQHRGLGLRMALRNSYDRAFSAIVDSNMTSMITSVCLYAFGSEEVKGFGLTLIIGILASLFTALFVTKTVFGIMIDKFGLKNLSSFPLTFPKWDQLLKPNIDWMGFAWVFYSFSIVAITTGLIFFGYYTYEKKMLDIEFASGTSIDFNMSVTAQHATWTAEEVRQLVTKASPDDLPAPSVIPVGNEEDGAFPFEVVTPKADATVVKNAIMTTVGQYMKLQLPSRFDGFDLKTADDARVAKVLFPIPADLSQWPGDLSAWRRHSPPDQAQDYLGGVAIQLNDLNPPLKPSDIRQRIARDRTKTPNQQNLVTLTVVSPTGDDSPTSTALVLVGNPDLAYSPDQDARWLEDLATPAWSLVSGAVNHEPSLVGVNSFNASVAGAARSAAMIALTLSILVIMAYIWFRFGNLKYGTATVIALLHDTIFTLAAMGFAHLLAGSAIGQVLELEPFRINLTVVAGILTIMGYSMIDTIVVFDRIRENRGKYGHLSRKIVNDAINQTLSRTLLTAGTTTVTVAFMYFLGGPGIHGFTFVLLIGILVGTYSSVAIAAPLLLIGKDVTHERPAQRASGE